MIPCLRAMVIGAGIAPQPQALKRELRLMVHLCRRFYLRSALPLGHDHSGHCFGASRPPLRTIADPPKATKALLERIRHPPCWPLHVRTISALPVMAGKDLLGSHNVRPLVPRIEGG